LLSRSRVPDCGSCSGVASDTQQRVATRLAAGSSSTATITNESTLALSGAAPGDGTAF
jgi:hypothetical protein